MGFDEAGGGKYLQKQVTTNYGKKFPGSNFNVQPGLIYDITITKQNVGPESAPTGVDITASVNGQQVGH